MTVCSVPVARELHGWSDGQEAEWGHDTCAGLLTFQGSNSVAGCMPVVLYEKPPYSTLVTALCQTWAVRVCPELVEHDECTTGIVGFYQHSPLYSVQQKRLLPGASQAVWQGCWEGSAASARRAFAGLGCVWACL